MTFSTADYEQKIRDLEDSERRIATAANDAAKRYAADLTAARGAILRLRSAIAEGAADAEQAWAIESAIAAVAEPGAARHAPATVRLCAALIALHEERKATNVRLQKIADLAYLLGARDTP